MPADAAAAETWDRRAQRYRRQEWLEARAIDTALRLAGPLPSDRLVDLGTGSGLLLRRLATRSQRPRTAVGIDRAAGMLAAVGELPSGWTTTLADARAVPLPAGWADVVTCAYVLHLLMAQQRVDVLAEARRLLRPSPWSRLVVVTVWADRRGPAGRLRYGALRRLARLRPEPLGGLQPLDPAAELEEAGFEVTRRVVLTRHGYPSLVLAGRPAFRTGTADVVA